MARASSEFGENKKSEERRNKLLPRKIIPALLLGALVCSAIDYRVNNPEQVDVSQYTDPPVATATPSELGSDASTPLPETPINPLPETKAPRSQITPFSAIQSATETPYRHFPIDTVIPISIPTEKPSPKPTSARTEIIKTVESTNIFFKLLMPFIEERKRRREIRQKEPEQLNRINPEINRNTVNVVIQFRSKTHEPPGSPDFIGPIFIINTDFTTLRVNIFQLTHDIWAPEIDPTGPPTKIQFAFARGEFELQRKVIENATSLAVDYQAMIDDNVIRTLIDEVLGGIRINSPFELDTIEYFNDSDSDKLSNGLHFDKGEQILNGTKAMAYLKALMKGNYDPSKENAIRAQIVINGIIESFNSHSLDPLFWGKIGIFLEKELGRSIKLDFDGNGLAISSIKQVLSDGLGTSDVQVVLYQKFYVVDPKSGDGGVRWIMGSPSTSIQTEFGNGLIKYKDIEVPDGQINPRSKDLKKNYWFKLREFFYKKLKR